MTAHDITQNDSSEPGKNMESLQHNTGDIDFSFSKSIHSELLPFTFRIVGTKFTVDDEGNPVTRITEIDHIFDIEIVTYIHEE